MDNYVLEFLNLERSTQLQNADNELEQQFGYAERVKQILCSRYEKQPLAFVHTYGCQQNVSDSERLKGLLELMGYGFTDELEAADLVLYNTCAVREHAEDRVFGNVGLLKACKRKKPGMTVIVCGCMTQQTSVADKIKRSYPYVDILFGTHVRHRLPEFLYRRLSGGERVFENPDTGESLVEGVPLHRDGTFKAWLPIMQGCNNFCTYCIVPYVRGREHSREQSAVIDEAKKLIESGAKEIMLLGQNVNSYGRGNSEKTDFAALLRAVNALPGDFRIRFMTSHPKDCSDELLLAMSECEKVEKHLHLPVQCGSDRLLKIMNRHYDTAKYMSLRKGKSTHAGYQFYERYNRGLPRRARRGFSRHHRSCKARGLLFAFHLYLFQKTRHSGGGNAGSCDQGSEIGTFCRAFKGAGRNIGQDQPFTYRKKGAAAY